MINEDFSDEQSVREVQKGHSEYFRLIIERYQGRIYSIGMRFFYNTDDSLDFAQEVFLKAFDKINSYREIAPFRYWLVKLAYNHAINMKKNIASDPVNSGDVNMLCDSMSPDIIHFNDEIRQILLDEINRLPERYRICLDLYFFFGLKYVEISEITGFPVNTIKSDVHRSKNILRQKLSGTIAENYDKV